MLRALLMACFLFHFISGLTLTVTQLAAIQGASHAAFSAAAILAGGMSALGGYFLQKKKVLMWCAHHIEVVASLGVTTTAVGAAVLMWGTPDARILVGATFLVVFSLTGSLYWEILKARSGDGPTWAMRMQSNNAAAGLAGSCTYFLLLMMGWDPSLGWALMMEVAASLISEVTTVIVFKKYKGPTEK